MLKFDLIDDYLMVTFNGREYRISQGESLYRARYWQGICHELVVGSLEDCLVACNQDAGFDYRFVIDEFNTRNAT